MNLLTQRIPIQTQQLGRLNLIALRLLKRPGDEWPLNRGNKHRMKIAARSVAHALYKISHLPFKKIFERRRNLSVTRAVFGPIQRLHQF